MPDPSFQVTFSWRGGVKPKPPRDSAPNPSSIAALGQGHDKPAPAGARKHFKEVADRLPLPGIPHSDPQPDIYAFSEKIVLIN